MDAEASMHDFGEVVPLAHREIANLPEQDVLPKLSHLVVDEYQDLNGLEQAFIEMLANRRNLVVVGDDDQSIYGFKFAHPQGIRSMVARSGQVGVEVVEMVECRRSPECVVNAANSLMRTDYERLKPDMFPMNDRIGVANVVVWRSQEEEVIGIAETTVDAVTRREIPLGEILVLVPNRIIGNALINEIRSRGVEVVGYFDQDILDQNPDAWRALSILDLLADPDDPLAWRMIWTDAIKNPYDNAERYRELISIANDRKTTVLDVVRGFANGDNPTKFRRFVTLLNMIETTLNSLQGKPIAEILAQLLPEDSISLTGVRMVCDEIISANPSINVSSFVRQLRSNIAIKHLPEEPKAVRVMTYHKSKGLTAGCVFVCSLIEGLLPTLDPTLSPEGWEESRREGRRLLYVAMTRTSSDLVLSSFRTIQSSVALGMGATGFGYIGKNLQRTRPTSMLTQLGGNLGSVISGEEFLSEYRNEPVFEPLE